MSLRAVASDEHACIQQIHKACVSITVYQTQRSWRHVPHQRIDNSEQPVIRTSFNAGTHYTRVHGPCSRLTFLTAVNTARACYPCYLMYRCNEKKR